MFFLLNKNALVIGTAYFLILRAPIDFGGDTTMPAKSLGILAVIYATDELQNPLPRKTMLCEGDMNNPVCMMYLDS